MDALPAEFRSFDFTNRRVTVMGLGRFGGGVGAVRFLLERGAKVTVSDALPECQLRESLQQIDVSALAALHCGGHQPDDVLAADMLVVNPAVPRDHPLLRLAEATGVPTTSELNLFWQLRRGPVIGVTGSNGKSTTAGLIHAVLNAAGKTAHLGGNIGGSLLPRVDEIGPDDWTVLEVSSFQLHDLDRLPSSPELAVVTNFSPNHLDWHGCLEEYRRCKQAILRWQPSDGVCVLNADDAEVSMWCHHGWCYFFGRNDQGAPGVYRRGDNTLLLRRKSGEESTVPLWNDLSIVGEHNLRNAMTAAAVGLALDLSPEDIARGLARFEPLPHRLQFVGEWEGRQFYNDSLATTPESVFAALDAFKQPVVLLAGGSDKGIDLTEFGRRIARQTKAAALIGETAEALSMMIDAEPSRRTTSEEFDDFESAFRWAVLQSAPGDVVLLSPGCASYDWFRNFAERGERFTELVSELATTRTTAKAR